MTLIGRATEELNRRWYEANSGQEVIDVQKHLRHPGLQWMGATLDGRVRSSKAVFESKFMRRDLRSSRSAASPKAESTGQRNNGHSKQIDIEMKVAGKEVRPFEWLNLPCSNDVLVPCDVACWSPSIELSVSLQPDLIQLPANYVISERSVSFLGSPTNSYLIPASPFRDRCVG